jgi:hypothetical protein
MTEPSDDDEIRGLARALFGVELDTDDTDDEHTDTLTGAYSPKEGTGNPVLDADDAREIVRELFSS